MTTQHYTNQAGYLLLWLIFTATAIIAFFSGSIVKLIYSPTGNLYSSSLLVLASLIFCSFFWYAHSFAVNAQDRGIRAEEKLPSFCLTGKLLDARLSMEQIIALRFAYEADLLPLAAKASLEGTSEKEIKKRIQN